MNDVRTDETTQKQIWVVEDDKALLDAYERLLTRAGYDVVTTTDPEQVEHAVSAGLADVVISDIAMPGMTGIELLRSIRRHDPDVPLLFVTGEPAVETAVEAIELGAFRYFTKPIEPLAFIEAVKYAVLAHRLARLKRSALDVVATHGWDMSDKVMLERHFESALSGLWMAYQPIVAGPKRTLVAYEALVRVVEPIFPHPGALFDAAERLDRVIDLGRIIRAGIAATEQASPAGVDLFVNLHPRDLEDPELYSPGAPLTAIASKVVLEITERASLSRVKNVRARIDELKRLGFRIAIDDLGAGYAGLTAIADLLPHVVKFDMSLVRDVDRDPLKERLLRSMTDVCRDMAILTVGEGVETERERAVLDAIGCDFQQGYLFAKPGRPYPGVSR